MVYKDLIYLTKCSSFPSAKQETAVWISWLKHMKDGYPRDLTKKWWLVRYKSNRLLISESQVIFNVHCYHNLWYFLQIRFLRNPLQYYFQWAAYFSKAFELQVIYNLGQIEGILPTSTSEEKNRTVFTNTFMVFNGVSSARHFNNQTIQHLQTPVFSCSTSTFLIWPQSQQVNITSLSLQKSQWNRGQWCTVERLPPLLGPSPWASAPRRHPRRGQHGPLISPVELLGF